MKNFVLNAIMILIFLYTSAQPSVEEKSEVKDRVDYVNPHIGTIAHLL